MLEPVNEDRRLIDLELFALNILLYALVFAFATHPIQPLLFVFVFYMVEARIFAAYHDRMHSNNKAANNWMEKVVDYFCVFVTPWSEPYASFKWKHFQHHKTYAIKDKSLHTHEDCHSLYQDGLVKSLLACMFYEEVQFFLDLRAGRVRGFRILLILLYSAGILLFIHFFDLQKFAVVFMAMRIAGFISWFSFSYGLHREATYRPEFHATVPRPLQWLVQLLFGRRVLNNTLHHELHHRYPSVRSRDLKRHYETHTKPSGGK